MIILKLACSELFCRDSVASDTWLMIFQSSCKHRIAARFTFKQKRSLQLSVQPTLQVPSTKTTVITFHKLPLLCFLIGLPH